MTDSILTLKTEFQNADAFKYDRTSPLRWLISHLLRYKGFVISYMTSSIFVAILYSAIPMVIGDAFDSVLTSANPSAVLLNLAGTIFLMVLLRCAGDLVDVFSIETLSLRLQRDVRAELYSSMLGKSQTFHNRQRVGDIVARANNDVRQLGAMISPGGGLIFDSLVTLVVPLFFILSLRVVLEPLLHAVDLGLEGCHALG